MQLIMYQTDSDPRALRKVLNHVNECGFFLKGGGSLLDLDVRITMANYIPNCNYIWIPQFDRYYFVGNPVFETNETVLLPLHQDVLSTWANQLESIYAIITRQENVYDPFIVDTNYKVWTHKFIVSKVLGQFDREETDSYVVTTTGGIQ